MNDPAMLGMTELDNTPWWRPDGSSSGSGVGLGRCNPFGYEDADVRVMGGLNDPRREVYSWYCRNWAAARYKLTCTNGHYGTLRLCYPHAEMITRRMSGVCPRCTHPPRARELEELMTRLMREIATAYGHERRGMLQRLEDARREMDELITRGEIRSGAPLRLEEIS